MGCSRAGESYRGLGCAEELPLSKQFQGGTHTFMAEWIKDHKNQMFKCLEKIEEAAACLGVLTVDGEAAETSITHFQQSATYAIRIALPAQMLYVSRTVPPSLTLPIAKEIDERITKCIFRISTGLTTLISSLTTLVESMRMEVSLAVRC